MGSNGEPGSDFAPGSDLAPGRDGGLAVDRAADSDGVLGVDGPSDSVDKLGSDGSAGSDGIAIGAMLGEASSDGIAMVAPIPGEASTDGIAKAAAMPVESSSDGIETGAAPMPGEPSSDDAVTPVPCAKVPNGMNSRVSAHANEINDFIVNSPSFAWHPNCPCDFASSGWTCERERNGSEDANSVISSIPAWPSLE